MCQVLRSVVSHRGALWLVRIFKVVASRPEIGFWRTPYRVHIFIRVCHRKLEQIHLPSRFSLDEFCIDCLFLHCIPCRIHDFQCGLSFLLVVGSDALELLLGGPFFFDHYRVDFLDKSHIAPGDSLCLFNPNGWDLRPFLLLFLVFRLVCGNCVGGSDTPSGPFGHKVVQNFVSGWVRDAPSMSEGAALERGVVRLYQIADNEATLIKPVPVLGELNRSRTEVSDNQLRVLNGRFRFPITPVPDHKSPPHILVDTLALVFVQYVVGTWASQLA